MQTEIRKIGPSDNQLLAAFLEKASRDNGGKRTLVATYPEELNELANLIDETNHTSSDFILAAFISSKIVGVVDFYDETDEGEEPTSELGITVLKEYHNQGVGKALLREAIKIAQNETSIKCILLSLDADNLPALKLYKQLGFRVINSFKNQCKVGLEMILVIS